MKTKWTEGFFFIAGECYWIAYAEGQHIVKKEGYPGQRSETVFTGHYGECLEYIQQAIIENVDYELNV